jgi:hypothetical protein
VAVAVARGRPGRPREVDGVDAPTEVVLLGGRVVDAGVDERDAGRGLAAGERGGVERVDARTAGSDATVSSSEPVRSTTMPWITSNDVMCLPPAFLT